MPSSLPYVDEHAIAIAAPRDVVWAALERYANALAGAGRDPFRRVLGTDPASGFAVVESAPPVRLRLGGRHRFSRYELAFETAEAPGGATQLRALTYAAFPGVHGRAYRALVIGTRAHVVATRHILRSIRRLSLRERRSS